MRRNWLHATLLASLSVAAGCMGWSGHLLLLPVALAFPLLWAHARSRLAAGLVSAGYFLAASRGLPQGVAAYYASDLWPGIALWLAASASFILIHSALWTMQSARRPFHYLLATFLMALPPFGITGWAHPITAAGVLFPGWGWLGLVVMIAGLAGLVSRYGPAVALGFATPWLWSAASGTAASVPETWVGVDLEMGSSLGRDNSLERQRELLGRVKEAASRGMGVVVFPESALGYWTPTAQRLWEHEVAKSGTIVLAGAAIIDAAGYDNVLMAVTPSGSNISYHERMPVPGAMWQPWYQWFGKGEGARANFFANPVIDVADRRIAPLICYEQLIVWPILQSMLYRPQLIVAVGNGWWAADSSIIGIQIASSTAWARLFNLPLISSINT